MRISELLLLMTMFSGRIKAYISKTSKLGVSSSALFKTNPNRVGRVLTSEGAFTTDTQSRWASTGLPYKGAKESFRRPPNFRGLNAQVNNSKASEEVQVRMDASCFPDVPGVTSGIVLEKGKARLFQDGNPLIYGGAVAHVIEADAEMLSAGNEVFVVDHFGNCIGRGVFNPHSQYRVRMLVRVNEKGLFYLPIKEVLTKRLINCIRLRASLGLGVSSKLSETGHTNVFRLCNGEGDKLSGLIIDVMGNNIVIQSSAVWCEVHKEDVIASLRASLHSMGNELFQGGFNEEKIRILWRQAESRLRQDGFTGESENGIVHGGERETVEEDHIVEESGILYYANAQEGQKTGFYADQRENRRLIRSLAKNKTVLDSFCYSGGFSISAALNGAKSVTCVDSSVPALDAVKKNLALNGILDENLVEVVRADAISYMKEQAQRGKKYDIVICDPPKLAPSRSTLPRAKGKYIKINTAGLSLVKDGGLFLTCTCSGAMTQQPEMFLRALRDSAKAANVEITILRTSNAAPDHVVHPAYPEGSYLTAVLCGVTKLGQ